MRFRNEPADGSPAGNCSLCREASETVTDTCISQTVNADMSMPSVTSFIWCSLYSFSLPPISSNRAVFPCVLQSSPHFYVSFNLTLILSTRAQLRHINFSHFYLTIFSFRLPTRTYTSPPLLILCRDFSASSIFIFHLSTLSLSLTQSCRLWCAPLSLAAFVLNLWKFMRRASSCCNPGWKCW